MPFLPASSLKTNSMYSKIIASFLTTLLFLQSYAYDNKPPIKANLEAVTVFRSGAEMKHSAKAVLEKGNNDLIIENISSALDISSVQIKTSDAVTVMGVEFNTDFLKEDTKSPRMKILVDSIENLDAELDKLKLTESIDADLLTVLKANKEIKGQQTGLSVAELGKMMDYYKIKSSELQTELATLKARQEKVLKMISRLKEQVGEEEKKNVRKGGKLMLQLNCAIAGNYDFEITYITANAYWNAFYDLKANHVSEPLKLIYRSKIYQTTGIDWKQVKLSLSTSMPSQTGNAPIFQSWFLSYINPVYKFDKRLSSLNTISSFNGNLLAGKIAGEQLNEVVVTAYGTKLRGAAGINSNSQPLYIVNGVEMEASSVSAIDEHSIKSMNVLKNEEATAIYGARAANGAIILTLKEGLDDYITVSEKELDVTFHIDRPYDVPTNGKAQTATLKEYDVPATYKYYSVPKLDKDAFLLAEVADWEGLNLLPGEANIMFEGTYVGKSFIDPNSTNDTINLTMGRDKRVVVKREKLKDFSSVKFLGTNKKQVFTYVITVKNNKKEEVKMQLKDQFPISQNKEVEVELLETSEASVNTDIGILNWKLVLAPNETKTIRFSYSVKYPKDKTLNLY